MTKSFLVVKKKLKVHENGLCFMCICLSNNFYKVNLRLSLFCFLWVEFFLFYSVTLIASYKRGKAIHKLIVKVKEIFWETRAESFLNIAVFTLWMFL